MKLVVAIDSFKGCLTSKEAGRAAAEGLRKRYPKAEIVQLTVSDGGEGMLDAFLEALGGKRVEADVHDPMLRPIQAEYGIVKDTAIIEVAKACGLTLVTPEERNAYKATSFGVGEMVADAFLRGCSKFIIGLGGTATTDGGMGMLQGLIEKLKPKTNFDAIRSQFKDVSFTLATDVTQPLYGEEGAARVFAPQKGASSEMVERLDKRLQLFSTMSAKHFGYDRSQQPGAGAAGGLGYAFMQYLDARCVPGADLMFKLLNFDSLLQGASLVITGEGSADRQTLMGKLPYKVMERAKSHGVATLLIAGRISDRDALLAAGFEDALCINDADTTEEEAMKSTTAQHNITKAIEGENTF